jgi:hypothetical protein
LIEERKNREQEVSDGITLNWGKDQVISSPVLAIPYRETIPLSAEKAEKSNLREELKWIFVLPKTSNIATDITPQHLSRGIYNAVVYNSNITLEGSFDKISLEKLEIPHEQIDWKGSKLIFGIQDFKGLGKRPSLNWDGNELTFDPDFNNLKLFTQNLVCPVSLDPQKTDSRFKIKLNLKGSKSLNFLLLAIRQTSRQRATGLIQVSLVHFYRANVIPKHPIFRLHGKSLLSIESCHNNGLAMPVQSISSITRSQMEMRTMNKKQHKPPPLQLPLQITYWITRT